MKLIRTQRSLEDYGGLPAQVQKQVGRKLKYLAQNIGHPSLRGKRVRKHEGATRSASTETTASSS